MWFNMAQIYDPEKDYFKLSVQNELKISMK